MQYYKVNEIFDSLQGEGANVGKPVTFIRLSGCNLRCEWCDTKHEGYTNLGVEEILEKAGETKSIIITGGEPMKQDLEPLLVAARKAQLWVGLETNGTYPLLSLRDFIDYITVSPKNPHPPKQFCSVEEVRVPFYEGLDIRMVEMMVPTHLKAMFYFLSPIFEGNQPKDLCGCLEALGYLNRRSIKWGLSLQTHKMCGIR